MSDRPKRVREQVMVYLTRRDREVLERLVEETGLSRTEIFRRGLWRMASAAMEVGASPGTAFQYLVDAAGDAESPPDLSERADHYLYGGGYGRWRGGQPEGTPESARDAEGDLEDL